MTPPGSVRSLFLVGASSPMTPPESVRSLFLVGPSSLMSPPEIFRSHSWWNQQAQKLHQNSSEAIPGGAFRLDVSTRNFQKLILVEPAISKAPPEFFRNYSWWQPPATARRRRKSYAADTAGRSRGRQHVRIIVRQQKEETEARQYNRMIAL